MNRHNNYFLNNILLFFSVAFFLLLSVSCKEEPIKEEVTAKDPVITTFYMIRHAEKIRSDYENKDPELTQDGMARALKWAEIFEPVHFDALYSTNYERTTMTIAPVSVKKNLDVKHYDPNTLNIEDFKKLNWGKNVLVVGHSNTTPAMANLLLGEKKYPVMNDSDNSSLFIVRFLDSTATDIRLRMD